MPQESQLAHRNIRNTNLPYRSNVSPTDTEPCFVTGSQDIMTSIIGYAERRPGFATNVENTPTTFNNLQRLFVWDRFDGTFIEMACDVNSSNQAVVYKRIIGTDNSFSSVYTDTGSSNVFDFGVSNNTVYFSNGHVAQAWDPVNGVRNWGIAIGSVNNSSGPNAPTAAVSVSDGFANAWSNPTNVETADGNFAIRDVPAGSSGSALQATGYGFAIAASTTIQGILVEVKGQSTSGATLSVNLVKNGNVVGSVRTGVYPASNAFVSLGGSSDLWGTTWTYNDINQSNFGVQVNSLVNFGGSTDDQQIDFIRATIYGLGGPTVSLTGTGLTATTGYQYVFCYGNSNSGHVSSPSPASAQIKPTNQSIQVSLTKSNDAQVNQIRVFRSTDSVAAGTTAAAYFEIPTSPFSNTTQNITDSAADTALNVNSIAPISGFNDPPTPFFQPTYFSGRFWGFLNNKVYFSGLEETVIGVPEESFVSGIAGNFWTFDQPVQALAVAGTGQNQTLMVFCGGRIYGITGNSLDTFRRFLISNRRGCRNRTCVSSLGGMVAWLDSASQVWATDGNSLQELSVDIRPDFVGASPTGASMTFHTAGKFHWLVMAFPSTMLIYDMDLEQWLPPWNVTNKYVYSGETSAGVYNLMISNGTKALMLSTTSHNDNGSTYTPVLKTNLFSVVPDFGKRFSYAAQGIYDEPSRTGYPTGVQIDTNNVSLGDVLICNDDDPLNTNTVYSTIFSNKVGPEQAYNRSQGTNLVQNIFPLVQPASRWIGLQIKGQNADDALKIYDLFLSYKPLGGR